ncbi:MAG: ParB/Srx family N-terminal domain-containing protein [Methylocella sp.]
MRKFSPAIEHVLVRSLRPYPRNARRHSKAQIKQIAVSIERFGFTNPVLIAEDGEIVAGHGRVAAAMLVGIDTVPALRLSQRRVYVLADNKLALNARAGTAKCSRSSYKVWSTLSSMSNLPASLWPRSIS